MKAAVVTEFREPLQIQELDPPKPASGQVLVQVETCGVCHTDIHAAHGDWPVKPKMPLIPGHEGVGRVVDRGSDVEVIDVGDRVALPWLGRACGRCRWCVGGEETYCQTPEYTGYTIDGSYAEYVMGYASHVVPVPDDVSSFDASPITCAGVTTYKALKVSAPTPEETVGVFGIGGLGHLGLQYAAAFGARTVAVDVEDDKLALAAELGADEVVDARGDAATAIAGLGGLDVALVTVPAPSVLVTAHAALNPRGRLAMVALPADDILPLPVFSTVLRGVQVIGTLVGTRNDLKDCFELHRRGKTKVIAAERGLDEVNAVFDEVLSGRVPARVVLRLS
jgi:propanol-preferring alcohol dehydrogenase